QVSASVERAEDGGQILRIKVVPGEPVRIRGLAVKVRGPGERERALEDMVAKFSLKTGDVLNQPRYEKAKEELKLKALSLGFLGAEFRVHTIRLHRAAREAEIELILETGGQYHFGQITWEEKRQIYPYTFLQRYLDFKPEEAYSYAKISRTQLNLINSDRFSSVTIRAEKEDAEDLRVPVKIGLEPSPPKRLRPGIGYATDTGATVSLHYQDLNAFHRGNEFMTDLSLAEKLRSLALQYNFLSPADMDSRTSLKGNLRQELLSTYDSELGVLEAERAHGFGAGRIGSVYLQYRYETYSVAGQNGYSKLVMPGIRFSQRRYDDIARPNEGFRYALDVRGAHQSLGSDTGLLQLMGEGSWLAQLPARFSLLTRLQVGATAQNDPLKDLPASIRFFAGGDRSVRGYAYQSLGPTNASGQVVGGKNLLVGSLEVEHRIVRNWGLAAFYDAGNAFNSFYDITFAQGAGIGVRYYTPVGPVRVDVARQIGVDHPQFRLHVTMGFGL
ncbi:MAG: autotransporter assembly complex protein TamA, partial [Deltaproteobacteria bacterium]|nr:autotransporter assembly complex protein TamA [Deltaproteobacteria bacterium]